MVPLGPLLVRLQSGALGALAAQGEAERRNAGDGHVARSSGPLRPPLAGGRGARAAAPTWPAEAPKEAEEVGAGVEVCEIQTEAAVSRQLSQAEARETRTQQPPVLLPFKRTQLSAEEGDFVVVVVVAALPSQLKLRQQPMRVLPFVLFVGPPPVHLLWLSEPETRHAQQPATRRTGSRNAREGGRKRSRRKAELHTLFGRFPVSSFELPKQQPPPPTTTTTAGEATKFIQSTRMEVDPREPKRERERGLSERGLSC